MSVFHKSKFYHLYGVSAIFPCIAYFGIVIQNLKSYSKFVSHNKPLAQELIFMTEWRDSVGIVHYSNTKLGIEDSENPTDSHFHPEGKEERVLTWGEHLGWEVGYRDSRVIYELLFEGSRIIVEDRNPGSLIGAHPSKVVYINKNPNR